MTLPTKKLIHSFSHLMKEDAHMSITADMPKDGNIFDFARDIVKMRDSIPFDTEITARIMAFIEDEDTVVRVRPQDTVDDIAIKLCDNAGKKPVLDVLTVEDGFVTAKLAEDGQDASLFETAIDAARIRRNLEADAVQFVYAGRTLTIDRLTTPTELEKAVTARPSWRPPPGLVATA